MIIGQIYKGIRKIVAFRMPRSLSDAEELAVIQSNLACRLATAPAQKRQNMIDAIDEIDDILNKNKVIL